MPLTIGSQPLLGPVVGLAAWSLVQEAWMYAVRLPAISQYHVDTTPERVKQSMDEKLPARVKWPADNYNHLHEQPTYFVAVALALNALGVDDRATVGLAWGYVGLRVVHSVVHSTTNAVMVRFSTFVASSAVFAALTAKAALIFFGEGSNHLEL